MKRLRNIILVLVGLLALLQIPFIYRRYQTGKLSEKIAGIQAGRQSRTDERFNEYKGIIHAHTSLGGHSSGGFDELIDAANSNGLDFVVMTEHWSDKYDTSALTLNGLYGTTLFIGGNEIDTADGDRFLMVPGSADAAGLRTMPTTAVLDKLHAENRLALITYPDRFKSWDSAFDGTEIFSLHTASKQANPFTMFFDLIWSGSSLRELTFAKSFLRPGDNLRQFDETSQNRKVVMVAGTDAHSNIGFHIFGDDTGGKLISVKLDPYESVLRYARLHVLLRKEVPLTRENLVDAVRSGHFYIGFDVFGDTSGFSFKATGGGTYFEMGEDAPLDSIFKASAPVNARFVLFKNGQVVQEERGVTEFTSGAYGPGVYRIEVSQDALGESGISMPWIISNPIYVR